MSFLNGIANGVMVGRGIKDRQKLTDTLDRLNGGAGQAEPRPRGIMGVLGGGQPQGTNFNPAAGGGGTAGPSVTPQVSDERKIANGAMEAIGKDASADWLRYNNQGATRDKPINADLVKAMSFLPEMGVSMHVVSGGQDGKGEGTKRTGSTRHDHGGAADADFYMGDRKLDWNNPDDVPIFSKIVQRAKANGVTGIGAGDDYMGAGRMHIGFGKPAVWGADGKGDNAPGWLREAYYSAAPASAPGHSPNDGHVHNASPSQMATQAPAGPQEEAPMGERIARSIFGEESNAARMIRAFYK